MLNTFHNEFIFIFRESSSFARGAFPQKFHNLQNLLIAYKQLVPIGEKITPFGTHECIFGLFQRLYKILVNDKCST